MIQMPAAISKQRHNLVYYRHKTSSPISPGYVIITHKRCHWPTINELMMTAAVPVTVVTVLLSLLLVSFKDQNNPQFNSHTNSSTSDDLNIRNH